MYWREHFPTHQHAIRAVKLAQSGRIALSTPQRLAAQAALSEVERAGGLGGLKKQIKKALKSTNVAKIEKALAAESAKLAKAPDSKKAPKRAEYVAKLQAQLAVAKAAQPAAIAAPTLPAISEPTLSLDPGVISQPALNFSQGGGGGGGGFVPATAETAASDTGLSLPVMIGLGAGGLLLVYLLMKKK